MEFPPSYALIDGNRVSTLIPNILPAPEGDDGYYGFDVNTILHYAGDGRWSYEEDAYNPMNFMPMVQDYIKRCHELGTISDDARTFAKNMNWELA